MNKDALREGHLLGKHRRVIEHSITVAVDQAENAVSRLLDLNRSFPTVPGTVRHIERAFLIKAHVDRPRDQCWRNREFERVAFRQAERMGSQGRIFNISRMRWVKRCRQIKVYGLLNETVFGHSAVFPVAAGNTRNGLQDVSYRDVDIEILEFPFVRQLLQPFTYQGEVEVVGAGNKPDIS
jgi:hypothetical protein